MENKNINDLIVKTNSLIEGFMDMTKNEYKFVLFLISKLKKDDKEFRKVKISVKEFSKLLEYKGEGLYEYLKIFEDSLSSKKIRILYENGDRLAIPWFGFIKYIQKAGCLEIAFNHDLAPCLLEIDIPYTKYYLKNIKALGSYHSIRLYEILKQYELIGTRTIEFEELKRILGFSNEYQKYSNFKRRILKKAQKEFRENPDTDIIFDFEEIKTGRSVTSIKFIIRKKIIDSKKDKFEFIENNLEIKKEQEQIEMFIKKFNKKYNTQLAINPIKGLVKKKGFVHIENTFTLFDSYLQLEKTKATIKSIEGFFIYICNNGYHFSTSLAGSIDNMNNFDQRDASEIDYEKYYYKVSEDE